MKKKEFLIVSLLLAGQAVLMAAGRAPEAGNNNSALQTGNPRVVIDSYNVRDYICIVKKSLHPNIDNFARTKQLDALKKGGTDNDEAAAILEGIRRGGTGSGFVYVDDKGRNYIITNYHVIVGAYRFSAEFEFEIVSKDTSSRNAPREREKIVFQNLTVLNASEEGDLAILAFPDEDRPFRRGIPLSVDLVKDGEAVSAAGYPGTTGIPQWALTGGTVVNSKARIPGTKDTFIQHGVAINPGNSGGPLLIPNKRGSRWEYSVVGINTFYMEGSGSNAFFAIPVERLRSFIQDSMKPLDENALKTRIDAFTGLLNQSSKNWVYGRLAAFLSTSMIAANPQAAVNGLSGSQRAIILQKIDSDDMPLGIGWAVAHNQIELETYRRNQNVQAEFLSLSRNNFGGYTVRFIISGYPYRSEWIREWGDWRVDSFFMDDGEYNDYDSYATPHPMGKRVLYTLQSTLDVDWYILDVPVSGTLTVRTEGSVATAIIIVSDPSTNETMRNTTIGEGSGRNARASGNVQAGKVYVAIYLSSGAPGEYALIAEMGDQTVSSTPSSPVGNVTITIVNNTGYTIRSGGIWLSEQEHTGNNLKAFNLGGSLGNNNSRRVTLPSIDPSKLYCMFLQDTDGDVLIRHQINITPDMTITFTVWDYE